LSVDTSGVDERIVNLDESTRRYHARVIGAAVLELENDDLLEWEVDELVDTVRMHTAALAGVRP
jgi:hypothetical protein